jgi:ribosomal protein S18 acetylase RimI-like enzyme
VIEGPIRQLTHEQVQVIYQLRFGPESLDGFPQKAHESISLKKHESFLINSLSTDILFIKNIRINGVSAAASTLIGMCWLYDLTETSAEIGRLAINHCHRNKGYAKELLIHATTYASSQGINTIYLDVLPQNIRAVSLYKKVGFIPCFANRTVGLDRMVLHLR